MKRSISRLAICVCIAAFVLSLGACKSKRYGCPTFSIEDVRPF